MTNDRRATSDVRMQGFQQRTPVAEVHAWLDANVALLPSEPIPLSEAHGRVLAESVLSTVDVPVFDRAMMDGFALRSADIQSASVDNPRELNVIGQSFPGRPYEGDLAAGQSVEIMTGASIPAGADVVVPIERVHNDGAKIRVPIVLPAGKHVGRRGEDIRSGSEVLSSGRRLRPQDVGVLSSIGVAEVPVTRQPRVRVVVTGNELLPAGSRPSGSQISDANSPMLLGLVNRDAGIGSCTGITPDNREAILAELQSDADVLLVSGGTSVGREDLAPVLIREIGELPIHGVAMRPGAPAGVGKLGPRLVFLLPGNPVSCLWAYDLFAGRAIRMLGGRGTDWPYATSKQRLTEAIESTTGRCDYTRVVRAPEGIEPLASGGASMLTSATRADGFVLVPDDCEGYPAGAEVDAWWYGP